MGRGGETLCGAVEGAQDCVYESSHPLPQGNDRQLQLNIGLESHVYWLCQESLKIHFLFKIA